MVPPPPGMTIPLPAAVALLPVGFLILIKGAGWLVGGAVGIAERFGVNPIVIGLTIVAMGTSSPEVAAAITAGFQGAQNLSLGNVFGANIANLAFIGGLTALIRPMRIQTRTLRRELPVMLAVSLVLLALLWDGRMTRLDAAGLLGLFLVLVTLAIVSELREARQRPQKAMEVGAAVAQDVPPPHRPMKTALLLVAMGFAALAGGANLTILSAVTIGERVGLSQAVIGLTILAIGTTLPELMTSVTAAMKGHHEISLGNLVGSNIFNALVVVGACGLTRPFDVDLRLLHVDYWIMLGVAAVFYPMALIGRRVSRLDGGLLFGGYVFYLAYLVVTQTGR